MKEFRPYEETKKWAQDRKIKSSVDWINYITANGRPTDIPRQPRISYKDEWEGWPDFLGESFASRLSVEFMSFDDCVSFARSLKFKSSTEWRHWAKTGLRPKEVPFNPAQYYANRGWKTWRYFLGKSFDPRW